jgi:hypothetical protein
LCIATLHTGHLLRLLLVIAQVIKFTAKRYAEVTDSLAMILEMINNIEQEDVEEKEGKKDNSKQEDLLPKIGLPLDFIHVDSDIHAQRPTTLAQEASAKTSTMKETPSVSTAHLLNEYMHYFAPMQQEREADIQAPALKGERVSPRSLWWIGNIIILLLLANIVTMLVQHSSRNYKNLAVIELEKTDTPPIPAPAPASSLDTRSLDYSTPALSVPKRRVLVISEETRKELLEQLKQKDDASVTPHAEESVEFYHK